MPFLFRLFVSPSQKSQWVSQGPSVAHGDTIGAHGRPWHLLDHDWTHGLVVPVFAANLLSQKLVHKHCFVFCWIFLNGHLTPTT